MTEMDRLERKIDALSSQMDALLKKQQRTEELFEDATPIMKGALALATEKLALMESKGYFAMGKGLFGLIDRIVEEYDAEDIDELAQNIVSILDVIRSLTQPEVMALVSEVSQVAEKPDQLEPLGIVGLARASSNEDAQRGVAVMVEVMRRLGQGVRKAARRESLRRQLGPRRNTARPTARLRRAPQRPDDPQARPHADDVPAPVASHAGEEILPGVALTDEGFLEDWKAWTPEVARRMAQRLGVEFTDQHRQLIEFARKEYEQTGASPNIRRLTVGSGLSTKQLYQMFPRSPGKATAMIAGLPKPVGCI